MRCANNLRQLGLAMHNHHTAHAAFPLGMVCSASNTCDADAGAFTTLLPYLEQDNTHRLYHFDQPWFGANNYEAVGLEVKLYFCPSNRADGRIDLAPMAAQWSCPLPPYAGALDYALNKGASGSLHPRGKRVPAAVRGAFDIGPPEDSHRGVRVTDIGDGSSGTFAMGEAAGGTPGLIVRSLDDPASPAIDPETGQGAIIDQSWGAAGVGDTGHPWYGSVFAVTAQFGLSPDPRDEPMNRLLLTPTVYGGDFRPDNSAGKDYVSGYRSRHTGGCNFLFCDGSTRFLRASITPAVYRALSTSNGGESLSGE